MPRVPYNPSLRLGRGFLTYDQTPRMLDAVVFEAAEVTSAAQRADVENNELVLQGVPDASALTSETKQDPKTVKQIVSYNLKMVEKASDVTDSLNISAALAINDGGVSVSGSGSYIDSTKVKSSDVNFMISVTVINDFRVVPFDAKLSPWGLGGDAKDILPDWLLTAKDSTAANLFTEIYGDSFVSGHHIGGQFNALVTIHTEDTQKKTDIQAKVNFSVSMVSGSGDFGMLKDSGISDTDTTITVSWQGGGQIKPEDKGWDMDTMINVAKSYADRVAENPAIFATEVTEYKYLKDYWVKFGQHNLKPQDFGLASWLSSKLLDEFVELKHVVNEIDRLLKEYPKRMILPAGQTQPPSREAIATERKNALKSMLSMRDWVNKLKDATQTYTIDDIFNFESAAAIKERLPRYKKPKVGGSDGVDGADGSNASLLMSHMPNRLSVWGCGDGSPTGYVECPSTTIDLLKDFTISVWARHGGLIRWRTVLSLESKNKSDSYLVWLGLADQKDGPWRVHVIAPAQDLSCPTPQTINLLCTTPQGTTDPLFWKTWNHLAFVQDTSAKKWRIYVNGIKENDTDISAPIPNYGDVRMSVGRTQYRDVRNAAWDGQIENAKLFQKAWSEADIAAERKTPPIEDTEWWGKPAFGDKA